VRIGIENCPMLFTADEWPGGKNLAISPAVWRRMFEEIPSDHFGLNYDPSHLVWQQMDEVAPIREFADRIFHVHANCGTLCVDWKREGAPIFRRENAKGANARNRPGSERHSGPFRLPFAVSLPSRFRGEERIPYPIHSGRDRWRGRSRSGTGW
jgi:hypothetical protein